LRDEQVEYIVAPYEADAQLAHLSALAPEEGGVSTIITEDSDLLAYGCKVVSILSALRSRICQSPISNRIDTNQRAPLELTNGYLGPPKKNWITCWDD
jgi:5'-3' exonuclease